MLTKSIAVAWILLYGKCCGLSRIAKKNMKNFFFVSLLLLPVFQCGAYNANDAAKTVSSDGSYSDTAQAIAHAVGKAQDGWTVFVGSPGGSYTWTNQLIFSTANVLTLSGGSTNNRPTIIFSAPTRSGIYLGMGNGNLVTIRDFIFDTGANGPTGSNLAIDGAAVCFRITDCELLNSHGAAFGIQVGGINATHSPGPYGVIDNCQFYFPGGVVYNYVNVFANGNIDNWCWTQPMTWGTANSVVVEKCAFSQPHAAPMSGLVEAMGGARLTIRYNNITNIPESVHGFNSGAKSSTLQVEMYENNWMLNDTGNTMSYLYLQRGGTAVVWSNSVVVTGAWNLGGVCQFWVECAASIWQSEWCTSQLQYPGDYPALQQIGQGVVNGAPGLVPVYCWGNNFPGTTWGNFGLGRDGGDASFIQQGRDIYTNSVMPNYTPLVFPHPLDTGLGGPSNNGTGTTTNSAVIPPSNLQAHPPAGQ